jgi:nitroreductase
MLRRNRILTGERCDRRRNPPHLRPAASRERECVDRAVEQLLRRPHEPGRLAGSSRVHSQPHGCRRLACGPELSRTSPRHDHDEVESVEERTRELLAVGREPLGRARALHGRIAAGAARAEIHGPNEPYSRREDTLPLDTRNGDDPVLERLAERLESRPLELAELVQEKDASVSEARLARTRPRAATHDRSGGSRVVRRAKGRAVEQGPACREQAGDRVDPRDLERFLERQRRQDPRQAPGQHRLARPGRASEEEVVPPGSRELERPAGALLTADVREIRVASVRAWLHGFDYRRRECATEIRAGFRQMTHRDGFDPCEHSLCGGIRGADQPRHPGALRRLRRDERTRDRPHAAVQGKLSERRVLCESFGRNLARRSQHGERDREVEPRPLLAQARRREIHRYPSKRPLELGARDAASNALLRLLASLVGQTDDGESRNTPLQVGFHLDRAGLQTDESMREGAREHKTKLERSDAQEARRSSQCTAGMDTFLAIASKRDQREYADREIPEDVVGRILDAGRIAGSAMNKQPWRFLVLENSELRGQVAETVYSPANIHGSKLAVAIITVGATFDAGRAAQNMMLAAWNDGVTSCPNGMPDRDVTGQLLEVGEDEQVIMIISFGYPAKPRDPNERTGDEWIARAKRKPRDEVVEQR